MTVKESTLGRVGAWQTPLWLGAAAILLAACGGEDGDADLRLAEAKVAAKERAVSSAQSEADAATAAFCDAARAYIVAVDRYGDVLNATAPTVGDVRAAGTDLAEPREDAMSGGEEAVDAQQALITAEQELAEAEAALAAAKAGSGESTTSTAPTSSTPTPLAPSATVNRVEQAEADFAAAQEGISDQTPLAQATQQFNAAAVALEMSWLRLFADAGCLTDEKQKQAEAAVRDYTVALQESLAAAGYYQDELDGVYGPQTVESVEALQEAHGLPVTGAVDKATNAALQAELEAKGGAAAKKALTSTAAVQQTLKLAGFWDGPVDGEWTPELTEALKEFQKELGVQPTGTVDPATLAALEEALSTREGAGARTSEAESATPSTSPSGSTTAPATAATTPTAT